jgi:hypothetical protein
MKGLSMNTEVNQPVVAGRPPTLCPVMMAGLIANPSMTINKLRQGADVYLCVKNRCQMWDEIAADCGFKVRR